MKALIERPIQQKGAMAEWHRVRADVAGGRDVSVFSVRPVRQAWWLRIRSGGQCRCTEDTHANSDRLPGAPRDVERLYISHLDIQYVLLWAWQSGCNAHNIVCI